MLIELNRFYTTAQVRKVYRIPDFLANEILSKAPVAATAEDGTRFHLEKELDEYLTEFSRKQRRAVQSQQDQTADEKITETERNILEALGEGKLNGQQLAKKAGYPCNSNFKNTLSSLVKRGLLVNDRPGYRNPKSGLSQV